MQRLWDRGPSTVRELLEALRPERELAYTTVLTVVDNLYKKRWLTREPDGRAHRYTPVLSREEYGAGVMREALSTSGDTQLALRNFVGQMSVEETRALRAVLLAHERATPS